MCTSNIEQFKKLIDSKNPHPGFEPIIEPVFTSDSIEDYITLEYQGKTLSLIDGTKTGFAFENANDELDPFRTIPVGELPSPFIDKIIEGINKGEIIVTSYKVSSSYTEF